VVSPAVVHTVIKQLTTAALAIAALLLLAAPAFALPRYASPAGAGADCLQPTPCDLQTAIEGAADGDEVILAPGDYGSPDLPLLSPITASTAIDIHVAAGAPRPRIFSSADPALVIGAGAALHDVELHHSGGIDAFDLAGFAERVTVESQAAACTLTGDGAVLRDSVCWATQEKPAVRMIAAGMEQMPLWTATLRNVTAYSRFGEGIRVTADNYAQLLVLATNVIAQGGSRDVVAEINGVTGERRAEVTLDHSNFSSRLTSGGGGATVPGAPTNQTSTPSLVDDPLGDFRQIAGSPTIDAGASDAANGPLDFQGEPRVQQGGTDIGADEFAPPPASVAPKATPDRTRPVLSGLTVQPFRKKRGARVRFRLSEAASVSFSIRKRVRGRRNKTGRCVSKRKRGRRCTKYVNLPGGFQRAGRTGANSFRYDCRLNRKALRRGRYQLVAVPRDGAGNSGQRASAGFRLVPRRRAKR
jgi:hypothetical protein